MRTAARFLLIPAAAGLFLAAGCGESSSITSPRGATAQPRTPAQASTPTPTPTPAATPSTVRTPATASTPEGYPTLDALVEGINTSANASPTEVVALFKRCMYAEGDTARRLMTATVDMMDVIAQLEAGVRTHLGDEAADELLESSSGGPGAITLNTTEVRIESREGNTAVLIDDASGETQHAIEHDGRWYLDVDALVAEDAAGAEMALGMFEAMSGGIKAAVAPALTALESGEITSVEQLQEQMMAAAMEGGAMDAMMEGIGEALAEGMQQAFEEGFEEMGEGFEDSDVTPEPVDADPLRPFADRMVELIGESTLNFDNGAVCTIETAALDLDSFEEAQSRIAGGICSFMIDCTVRVTPEGGTAGPVQEWSFMINTGWEDGTNEWSNQPRGWHKNGCSWGFSPDGFPEDLSRIETVSAWLEELSDKVNASDG